EKARERIRIVSRTASENGACCQPFLEHGPLGTRRFEFVQRAHGGLGFAAMQRLLRRSQAGNLALEGWAHWTLRGAGAACALRVPENIGRARGSWRAACRRRSRPRSHQTGAAGSRDWLCFSEIGRAHV